MNIKIILIIYIGFLFFNRSFADSYYDNYIYNNIILSSSKEIYDYSLKNKEELITIGCVAKSIAAAGIFLFSQDPKNEYFSDILLKSIIDEFGLKDGYINTDLINNGLNYDKENTINKLHLRFINNTNELIEDSRIKEIILEDGNKYFQEL